MIIVYPLVACSADDLKMFFKSYIVVPQGTIYWEQQKLRELLDIPDLEKKIVFPLTVEQLQTVLEIVSDHNIKPRCYFLVKRESYKILQPVTLKELEATAYIGLHG